MTDTIEISTLKPLDESITVFGISCVGKTTFAKALKLPYFCFDALFPWHEIESFGMSISNALKFTKEQCKNSFVLDGWHTSDLSGKYLPCSKVYVVYSEYENILKQYPKKVVDKKVFLPMFARWYSFEYSNARYFYNNGNFQEKTYEEYKTFIANELNSSNYPVNKLQ